MESKQIDWFKLSDLNHLICNKGYRFAKYRDLVTSLEKYISFESPEEYEEKMFPLFQNENYQGLQKEMAIHKKIFLTSSSYPLKFSVMIDEDQQPNFLSGIRLQVVKQIKEQKNKINSWKFQRYGQYLTFKKSTTFIGGIFIKQNKEQIYQTLCLHIKKDKQEFIILPYTRDVINNFGYIQLNGRDNIINLKRKQFIINFIPLSSPKVYLNEVRTIFRLYSCSFHQLILRPSTKNNEQKLTAFGKNAKQIFQRAKQNSNFTRHFDKSQLEAIGSAMDFEQKFTLIEGPPGTGKTQTILGILSIFQSLLKESRNEDKKDVILILGKSNGIVNDLVRKINKSIETQNSIIYCSEEQPQSLKVLRYGRPDLCENDIARYSVEIRSQQKFFSQFKVEVTKIFQLHITSDISQELKNEQIQDFSSFLMEIDEQNNIYTNEPPQISIVQLMKYIEYLNFRIKNSVLILKAFGHVFKDLHKLLKSKLSIYLEIQEEIFKFRHIIASTLNSCNHNKLQNELQNVNLRMCIIDEAPTALEPSQLIPFIEYNNIEKIVLVGDTKQLSPIVIAKESESNHLNRSLFERMLNCIQSKKLTEQYRQMPNLAEITSKIFYSNSLKKSKIQMQIPTYIEARISPNKNSFFFNTPYNTEEIKDSSFRNVLECEAIIQLVKYILSVEIKSKKNKIISIISPYQMQKELLRLRLKQQYLLNYVEVDTVDSFQGKENEIVILSLVRSKEQIGFLYDKRRANVALSRAKYCQYVFGSESTFIQQGNKSFWRQIIQLYQDQSRIIDYDEESLRDPNFFQYKLNG
ncbi:unnamed protein product [Paramecium octaurelia]|uniref:Uncharacterized protein n=1 Tax=Paramecium octaurelia TaxID=43137 RepID=A0A8S1VH80_PAROT|nr:unnamed protein product [Paramecium octaurelia]